MFHNYINNFNIQETSVRNRYWDDINQSRASKQKQLKS